MDECSHYKRHCALKSPCCGKTYICRLCHDESENHTLDRFSVTEIVCQKCKTLQKVQKECEKCSTVFGLYFCGICRMFDDSIDKKQFHCDPCGLCRIGGRENYNHCTRCDMCFNVALKEHRCIEKVTHANCPICLEHLHTSVTAIHVPRCTHLLHVECYKSYLKTGNFRCPTCGESLVEMRDSWRHMDREVANTPMPEEYRNRTFFVLCKDCHKTTEAPFHIVGMKCQACGSYNTCNTDAPDESHSAGGGDISGDTGGAGANADCT